MMQGMPPTIVIVLIIFFSTFIQTSMGFGGGLIAMSLLVSVIGISTAAPAFALIAMTTGVLLFWRYRHDLSYRTMSQVLIAALAGIPLGVAATSLIPERIILVVLGVVTAGYGLYSLISPSLPALSGRGWAWAVGLCSGVLHGAYTTGGPPLIIYGDSHRWPPFRFKGNLQSVFLVMTFSVVVMHLLSGNITETALHAYLLMLPGTALGLYLGSRVDRRFDPSSFRKGVQVFLVILGVSLIL